MVLHFDVPPTSIRLPTLLLLRATLTLGVLVNHTIDDQRGDSITGALPTYLPGAWNDGQTCFTCNLRPGIIDPSQAFDGTWSDIAYSGLGSPDRVVQVSFTGSAVYVYNIVVDSIIPGTDTLANLTFYFDNELVGAFNHEPVNSPSDSPPEVSYHVLVYGNMSFPHGEHSLQMVTSGVRAANALFDYVVYTTEDDAQSSSQQPPTRSTSHLTLSSQPQPQPQSTSIPLTPSTVVQSSNP